MRIARTIVLAMLACFASATLARADGNCVELSEWGVRGGGGINPSNQIQYYAFHPYVGLSMWDSGSRWSEQYGIRALWMIEPWIAYVNDAHGPHKTESFEIGLNLLFVRLVFSDWVVKPFVEAGEGAVYTDLRKQDLGTRLQFTSTIGAGLEYEVKPGMSIGLQARLRHMSNAGMATSNPGVNTFFGLVGLTFR